MNLHPTTARIKIVPVEAQSNERLFWAPTAHSPVSKSDLAEVDRTFVSQLERSVANPWFLIVSRVAGALNLVVELSFVSMAHEKAFAVYLTEKRPRAIHFEIADGDIPSSLAI